MRFLDRLTTFHNRLSDTPLVWWPYGFLRPARQDPITFIRTLVMAPCFALYFLLAYLARQVIFDDPIVLAALPTLYLRLCAGFVIWFNAVTRPIWNRRARHISTGSVLTVE